MPYKNILWIKLEKRLLNDPRFFLMSEKAQLYYIKLLLLCALYNNKVPRKYETFKELLRTKYSEKELDDIFMEIRNNFPKVLLHKDFYYIKGFKEHHNWIDKKELLGNSEGTPKYAVDKIRLDKIKAWYINLKGWDEANLTPSDYSRIYGAIKKLLLKAKGDTEAAKEAIEWVSKQGYSDWTIETATKKYDTFLAKREEAEVKYE